MTKSEFNRRKAAFLAAKNTATNSLDDETALDAIALYPYWKPDIDVSAGERYQDKGILYRCIQSHRTQSNWPPDITPALWARVSIEEWPEWVQPHGAADAYNMGDKTSHFDRHWVSTVDNNVWEPGVYGWEEIT